MTRSTGELTNKDVVNRLGAAEKSLEWMQSLQYALVVVLFIGFAGVFVATAAMLVDAWNRKQSSCEFLAQEIHDQTGSIEALVRKSKVSDK